jgi:oxygen-independent coproporphyrinogen-3 oxidase
LEEYTAGSSLKKFAVSRIAALEETLFLGLRLNRGLDLQKVAARFGPIGLTELRPNISALVSDGLLYQDGDNIRLTSRGRLVSNEVFQSFIVPAETSS